MTLKSKSIIKSVIGHLMLYALTLCIAKFGGPYTSRTPTNGIIEGVIVGITDEISEAIAVLTRVYMLWLLFHVVLFIKSIKYLFKRKKTQFAVNTVFLLSHPIFLFPIPVLFESYDTSTPFYIFMYSLMLICMTLVLIVVPNITNEKKQTDSLDEEFAQTLEKYNRLKASPSEQKGTIETVLLLELYELIFNQKKNSFRTYKKKILENLEKYDHSFEGCSILVEEYRDLTGKDIVAELRELSNSYSVTKDYLDIFISAGFVESSYPHNLKNA